MLRHKLSHKACMHAIQSVPCHSTLRAMNISILIVFDSNRLIHSKYKRRDHIIYIIYYYRYCSFEHSKLYGMQWTSHFTIAFSTHSKSKMVRLAKIFAYEFGNYPKDLQFRQFGPCANLLYFMEIQLEQKLNKLRELVCWIWKREREYMYRYI